MNILDLVKNRKAIIATIAAREESLAKQLLALGMDQGAEVELKYKAPFNGPICIKTNEKLIVLRKEAALHIQVEPV